MKVTCFDPDSGETETKRIHNDWLLVCDGDYYLHHVTQHANGTAVVTAKGNTEGTLTDMGSTTYNHRKGQTFATAMRRSAEARRCPQCDRKSALVRDNGEARCRWDDCGYEWLRSEHGRSRQMSERRPYLWTIPWDDWKAPPDWPWWARFLPAKGGDEWLRLNIVIPIPFVCQLVVAIPGTEEGADNEE